MKLSCDDFHKWRHKRITLLGMSGVGKTYLSNILRGQGWFHYSGDYRIGTRYLDEDILDMVKQVAMKQPLLGELLRKDWIYISNNIKIDDLGPVLAYVGKLGNPELGGVELDEFIHRQEAYRQAEIMAMYDVPTFIDKSKRVYGYDNFVNDAGGSLCEIGDEIIEFLDQHSLLVYIKITDHDEEQELIRRAKSNPKPLYYRPDFLRERLAVYLDKMNLKYAAEMDPDEFTSWIFPRLFCSRIPRYNQIAKLGCSVTSKQVADIRDEQDFLQLIELVLDKS